ncbi:MAG: TetR/AcrR family transcriptional regulator [Armatimonadetes bacterium]|nr:TetR/AcrR family transcriptional regulator [Armatimonadota bacterium]
MQRGRRLKSSERKAQVVQVALDVIAERGIQGTTLERIATAAGVTRAALYTHFAGKREIMVAALDVLFEKIWALHHSASNPDALERIREIGVQHSKLLGSQREGFVFPLFEFMAAPPEEGLREELRVRHLERMREVAEIVKEGQAQGTIAPEADPYQVAWLMASRAWTEDVATLIGATGPDEWTEARSNHLLDLILASIAVDHHRAPDSETQHVQSDQEDSR